MAAIVEGCLDSVGDRVEPWVERKRRYLAHLPAVKDDAILRDALADKGVHSPRICGTRCESSLGCSLAIRLRSLPEQEPSPTSG